MPGDHDQWSRRNLLRLLSVGGITVATGCGQQQVGQSPNETSDPTLTDSPSPREQTGTPSASIDVRVTSETGVGNRLLVITGGLSSSVGIDTIVVEAGEQKLRRNLDGVLEHRLNATLEVMGGDSYTVDVVATDSEGRSFKETLETEQISPFIDPIATDRLVGTHYYPWYDVGQDAQSRTWTDESVSEPALGEYSSDDPRVIDRHIKWCLESGIRWLSVSWWGEGLRSDRTLEVAIEDADHFDKIDFSILYETKGRLEEYDYDLDEPAARTRLKDDLQYLEKTYFSRDNYLHMDGRPVIFVYISNVLRGDVKSAFEDVFDVLETRPYILADLPFGASPSTYPVTEVADAITTYNPYTARPDIEDVFHGLYDHGNKVMHLGADLSDVGYVPAVIPGFNDTQIPDSQREDNPVLEASPERYEEVCEQVAPHLEESEAVLVTSFNEWYENTQIEPNDTYGTAYLDRTADALATGMSPGFDPTGVRIRLEFNKTIVPANVNPNSSDKRELAFMAGGIKLLKNGEAIRAFEIGTMNEPLFLEGAYSYNSAGGKAWRWLGGAEAQTTIFVEGEFEDVDELVLIGEPMRSDEIEADVFIDGARVAHIDFRERDGEFDRYIVQL